VATQSVANWGWPRRPDARAESGCVVSGKLVEFYHPWEKRAELLTAIRKVSDEEEAVSFARQWGLLGLVSGQPRVDTLSAQRDGALLFASGIREQAGPKAVPDEVYDKVKAWFDQRPAVVLVKDSAREPIQLTLEFAETIRYLSEAKRVRDSFAEDRFAADYDAAQWAKSLLPHSYRELGVYGLDHWRKEYEKYFAKECSFYEYLLDIVIGNARLRFFDRRQRGVWVELDQRDGRVLLEFDGLFRFIAYCLLSNKAPSPKRCEDPQCGQLFFPTRSSRRFCPPLPGRKHSRCGERYGKKYRRAKKAGDGMAGS